MLTKSTNSFLLTNVMFSDLGSSGFALFEFVHVFYTIIVLYLKYFSYRVQAVCVLAFISAYSFRIGG